VGTPEGRGPVGRPRRGWEDYIKIAVKGIELGGRGLNSSFGNGRRAMGGLSMTINLRFP
jgi:hypothetical protein